MSRRIDLTGQRFGRLKVLEELGRRYFPSGKSTSVWRCLCDCGKSTVVQQSNIASNKTKSCGCLFLEMNSQRNKKHARSRTPEYRTWSRAKQRCRNPNVTCYADYGGRGITFSPVFDDFEVFLAEIGPRPSPQHSIDRIKNDRGYEPGNIRWATPAEQANNRRQHKWTVWLLVDGERMSLIEAVRKLGIYYGTVRRRRTKNWPVEEWFYPSKAQVTFCD